MVQLNARARFVAESFLTPVSRLCLGVDDRLMICSLIECRSKLDWFNHVDCGLVFDELKRSGGVGGAWDCMHKAPPKSGMDKMMVYDRHCTGDHSHRSQVIQKPCLDRPTLFTMLKMPILCGDVSGLQ